MFQSPDEWLKHIRWQHTLVWCCQAPGHELDIYESQIELEKHLRSDHPNSFAENQLSMLVQKSGRPVADTFGALTQSIQSKESSDDVNQCPLCRNFQRKRESHDQETQNIEALSNIQNHILGHLESIALLSLPEEEQLDDKSETVEVRSRETIEVGISDLPSANFEESDIFKIVQYQSFNLELTDNQNTPPPLEHEKEWSTTCKAMQAQREKKKSVDISSAY